MRGRPIKQFRFRAIGVLVGLGHRTAAAEIRGWRFSGLLAWLMWRTIYLSKLPGMEKKVRVALDWTIDLFFPRDIAMTSTGVRAVPNAEPAPREILASDLATDLASGGQPHPETVPETVEEPTP